MKLFETNEVQQIVLETIQGGQDPGKTTNTYDCTWQYRWANGSGEETADTEVDGDWLDDCEQ